MVLCDKNGNPGLTTMSNNKLPLNILPFHIAINQLPRPNKIVLTATKNMIPNERFSRISMYYYSGISIKRTPLVQKNVFAL